MSKVADRLVNTLIGCACVVVIVAGILRISSQLSVRDPTEPPAAVSDAPDGVEIDIRDMQRVGAASAKLALVEFSDFECSFCAQHATTTYEAIVDEFVNAGKLTYVFMHFPLEKHANAKRAGAAAECAGDQGRFLQMRNVLFSNRAKLGSLEWASLGTAAGLDVGAFNRCLNGSQPRQLASQLEVARRLGIKNTPSFAIGTTSPDGKVEAQKIVIGAQSIEVFREALQEVVTKQARK